MDCGQESPHDAQVVTGDLVQGGQAVGGTGGVADILERLIIRPTVHTHLRPGASAEGAETMTLLAPPFE